MTGGFLHPAFFYRDDDEYVDGIAAFVREGLAAGERVGVAVPGPRVEMLRRALGERDASAVDFTDMTRAGRNPGRIIAAVLTPFCNPGPGTPPGRRARMVGEPIWPGRTPEEYAACVQHEALINFAFAGCPVTVLCPYDAKGLDPAVLDDARTTHPVVIEDGREAVSERYAPEQAIAAHNRAAREPRWAESFTFGDEQLRAAREFAVVRGAELGLRGVRIDDLALAASELTTNSVVHGGGTGTIRIWAEDGHVVCEVHDAGRLTDPLAGRRVPPPGRPGGRGLLMVNQLADLVRTHTTPTGTTVRCYLALTPA